MATVCDSLIIEISGTDIGTLRYSTLFDPTRTIQIDTLSRVPTGIDRTVKVYTVDRSGATIHVDSISHRSVRIDPNVMTRLTVMLVPSVGSIYLQLENIPTSVDSVFADFRAADARSWGARAKRSSKMYMSIDRVPHQTRGVLTVAAVDTAGDTLYAAVKEMEFSATAMGNVALNFATTPGGLDFGITTMLPGVVSAVGNVAQSDTVTVETGELLISEIMYAANDSEYVEVYNPGSADLSYDSLYLDIDGTLRLFTDVAIAAQKTFVFGRKLLPWTDAAHPTASALDLSSTGNWISLRGKDKRLIDRVIFAGGANALEWPVVSGKKSIELDAALNDASANNFGRNWRAAADLISGSASQYGTPRSR